MMGRKMSKTEARKMISFLLTDLVQFHGTGSYPPLANGWHRAIRAAPIHPPRSQPYLSIASYV
jgi:hypothetical protein